MRVTSSRVVYENRWMRVHEDRTELADGTPGLYGWVEKPPAAIIVPLEEDAVWLVQQYRHPVGRRFWEFPQGAWEQAPDADAEALARGELAEETGLRAARLEGLGRLYFAYGLSDQYVDVWRATGLEPGAQALEPTEYGLVARRFERTEVERMIRDNEIRDAASVAAWHLASNAGDCACRCASPPESA
jgi:8-oxo-dGTP pyrophosphatase MutT (NUDIX family)